MTETILVLDVIFLDKYGALASATIYTQLLLVIVACNKEQVRQAIRALTPQPKAGQMTFQQKAKVAVVALVVMGVLFAFDQWLVNLFGHGRG